MGRYEAVRGEPGHHHHLVCDRCGRLQPFTDDGLELAIRRLSDRVPLRVSEHEIVIHGSCDTCAAA
jgi:Fur family ferric uptake transcriptional regulator